MSDFKFIGIVLFTGLFFAGLIAMISVDPAITGVNTANSPTYDINDSNSNIISNIIPDTSFFKVLKGGIDYEGAGWFGVLLGVGLTALIGVIILRFIRGQ